jgi:O-antigen ligase
MGSSFDIFADYATADTWYLLASDPNADTDYDTHNALLSVFINSGIVGLAFVFSLFRMVWNQTKKWAPGASWNKTVFFGIFIVPLFTIGITIPIYENAIFWISLGFLIHRWKFYTDDERTVET